MNEHPTDDRLTAFLAEAARVEPDRLATPAQLLWRADILARLEARERRARRASLPAVIAIAIATAVMVVVLTLAFGGAGAVFAGSRADVLPPWMTSPLWVAASGGTILLALLIAIGRSAARRDQR